MAERESGKSYAELVGARRATKEEISKAGRSTKGTSYMLNSGEMVSRRQLEQMAFKKLGRSYKTLEGRSSERRTSGKGRINPFYYDAVRWWGKTHNESYNAARQNKEFKSKWNRWSQGERRSFDSLSALVEMKILRRFVSGNYVYTEEYSKWKQ